jgi:PAS domain S-box-containing protein
MTISIHTNQILMLTGAVLSLMVFLVGWPRRNAVGGFYFAAFSFFVTWWNIASMIESLVVGQNAKILWSQISYIGFVQAYPYLFMFIVSYIRQRKIPLPMFLALMVIPFFTLGLAWTNSYHGWLWSGFTQGSLDSNILIYQHGFWFWVHVGYLYSLMLIGIVSLIRNILKSPPAFRRQLLVILAGSIFPIITGSMYLLGLEPVPGMDITPSGLVFTSVFFVWGLLRYQLLDLLPVARTALVEHLQDGVFVLDPRSRIVDINQAAHELFGCNYSEIFGQDIARVSPVLTELVSSAGKNIRREIVLPDSDRILDAHVSILFSETHQEVGKLLVLRDITGRKQAENERQTLLEIMQGLVVTKDLHEFISLVHHSIANVIYAENFFVVLHNKYTDMFEEVYSVDKYDLPGPPSRLEKSACAYVFRSGQPELITQERFDELAAKGEVELVGANSPSWLGVPLKTSEQTIGVMVVQDYETANRYSERDIDFIVSIAGQVALALERKQAETVLRESEAMLKKVQGVAHLGSWEIDLITKTVTASEEAHKIYGIAPGAMTLADVQSVPLPEFRPILDAGLTALITEGKRYDFEFKIRRQSDGEIRDVHSIAEYYPASQTIIGSLQDITERKRAEDSIRQRVMELETINHISHVMRSASKQEEMLSIVLNEALAILNTSHGSIKLHNKITDTLDDIVMRGWVAQINESLQACNEGIAGKVFTSGETYITREFSSDPMTYALSRSQFPPGWGGACLPIRTTQKTLGAMMVSVPSERELNKDEIRLLSILSEMTGAALQRMQLYTEASRRAEEFAALYETSRAISAENELNTLLQNIVEHARELLNSASSGIYLYLAESEELVLTVETADYPLGTRIQKGEGIAGRVVQTRQPLRIDDYSTWEGRSSQYEKYSFHAVLEVPMLYSGELIGVLSVDETGDSKRKFSDADEYLLSLFASQAAGAIHSARLHKQTAHRLEQLNALRAVDQAISSSRDMHLTLNILLTQTLSRLNVDAASVLLLQSGSNELELVAGLGFHTLRFENINLRDSIAWRAIQEHRPIMTLDSTSTALHENLQFEKFWKGEGFSHYWCVPLSVKGEIKGVLEVYCRKNFTPDTEWIEFLQALAGQAAITIDNTQLFENLQRSNQDLSLAYDATIEGWSRAMDLRDHETEGHTLRVTDMTLKLARAMRISESQLTAIRRGALLHDIGKIGIPDSILLKEGELTDEEWVLMRKHPQLAYDMLMPIAYLHDALTIPYYHHERWNGTGYPQGLKGDHIPLVARIFAIVDVWDALTNDRTYRKKMTKQKATQYIKEQSGKHFDPRVVSAFLKII